MKKEGSTKSAVKKNSNRTLPLDYVDEELGPLQWELKTFSRKLNKKKSFPACTERKGRGGYPDLQDHGGVLGP